MAAIAAPSAGSCSAGLAVCGCGCIAVVLLVVVVSIACIAMVVLVVVSMACVDRYGTTSSSSKYGIYSYCISGIFSFKESFLGLVISTLCIAIVSWY